MIIHLFGIRGSDTGSADLDTETGQITVIPGNRYDDVKHALGIIRQAVEIKDPKLRQASIKAGSDYFNGISEVLSLSGNVIAIF